MWPLSRAAAALEARNLGRARVMSFDRGQALAVEHRSGVRIWVHRQLFFEPFYPSCLDELWARSAAWTIADVPARVLSREDNLLHVCGHASYSSTRDSLLWVCDAWLLIARGPGLDCERLIQRATDGRLLLPLSVLLEYLVRALDAPVPEAWRAWLRTATGTVDRIGRDVALFGARSASREGLTGLVRAAGGWKARAILARWLLFPSAAYMRHAYNLPHPSLLSVYYPYRLLRYLVGRVRLIGGGRGGGGSRGRTMRLGDRLMPANGAGHRPGRLTSPSKGLPVPVRNLIGASVAVASRWASPSWADGSISVTEI